MARMQLTVSRQPTDEIYSALLQAAPGWCSKALLVLRDYPDLSETGLVTIKQLEPHLLASERAAAWPGTAMLSGSATVLTYRLNAEVISVLDTAARGLYEWQQPELPEDLCLLREQNDPWLVTISHERDAYVVLEPHEFEQLRDRAPAFAALLVEEPEANAP